MFGIVIFILVSLFFAQLVLGAASSSIPSNDPLKVYDSETTINDVSDSGLLLGFSNDHEVQVKGAVVKTIGNRVEVTLGENGKMSFNGNTNALYGDFDSKNMDLSKKNKFVFENGVLVEAEFKTNSQAKDIEHRIAGIGFFVPGSSKVVLKDNTVTVIPEKNPGYPIDKPFLSNSADSNNPNPLKVNYVAPEDGLNINFNYDFNIPLKEGTISFLNNKNDEMVLLGEKVVLDGGNTKQISSRNTVLNGIEIKNHDSVTGTSLFLGETDGLDSSGRPYINIISNLGQSSIVACVACDGGSNKYVIGYDVTISPDKNGNSPLVSFNSGNPIFPKMTEDQSIVLQSGSSKLSILTVFSPSNDGENDIVKSTVTAYSDNAKIKNGDSNYVVRQGDSRLEWYTDRAGKNNNNYPMTLNLAQQKGSLTVYPDTVQVEGQSITMVRNSLNLEEEGVDALPKSRIGQDIKFRTMDIIGAGVGKLFGEEAESKTRDFFYNLFFPKGRGPRPV